MGGAAWEKSVGSGERSWQRIRPEGTTVGTLRERR